MDWLLVEGEPTLVRIAGVLPLAALACHRSTGADSWGPAIGRLDAPRIAEVWATHRVWLLHARLGLCVCGKVCCRLGFVMGLDRWLRTLVRVLAGLLCNDA